jgi:site-specific DNA recombinase
MKAFIERIEMFPEKRKDGSWIRKIVFNFPVPVDGEEVKELPLETETTVETVCLLSKLSTKQHIIEVELDLDELDLTAAESKATYEEIKEYVLEHAGLKVSHLYIAQVKHKYGIIERENYNKPKSENARQPKCPPKKWCGIKKVDSLFSRIS